MLICQLLACCLIGVAQAAPDLVLDNGLIYDGTGRAPFKGDVAIEKGRIIVVGDASQDGDAVKVIDVSGFAIAPGFIDTPLTQKNNHPMPFIMDASTAAKKIINAVQAKKTLYLFPFSMKILIIILDKMPRFLYRWILIRRN